MPYRTFIDSTGTEWQVWDIVPQLTERRGARGSERERRVDIIPIAFADRRRERRRLVETHRAVLRGSYAQGWLCFQSDRGKRRLTPIPKDWTVCDDDRLESYIRRAERVSGATQQITDFNAEPPMEEAG
jgi:hypothetical protein